jgi:hypothetical protein
MPAKLAKAIVKTVMPIKNGSRQLKNIIWVGIIITSMTMVLLPAQILKGADLKSPELSVFSLRQNNNEETNNNITLSPQEKARLTPLKASLIMSTTAVLKGDLAKAKAYFYKSELLWTQVSPLLKNKVSEYETIKAGINIARKAMKSKMPNKEEIRIGLTTAIEALNAAMDRI